jgi:drug/metabolite transporter (DMT)-like permease
MHKITGRWQYGFFLALITALMWGILPIFLKLLLRRMDPFTITWYRFLIAALLLGGFLLKRGEFPKLKKLDGISWGLLAVAIFGLTGNYVIYLLGLRHVTPETAQMVIQLAPMFLLLGGLVFFRESFRTKQLLGLVLLIGGLMLFFNERLKDLSSTGPDYQVGIALIVLCAAVWAAYGLAQKRLLAKLRSDEILSILYLAAVIVLLPTARPGQVSQLNTPELLILAFCCLNTVIAYGSFAEALDHWEASRVSAVLATTPLITLTAMWVLAKVAPSSITPEKLNIWAIAGAFITVTGSVLAALSSQRSVRARPPSDVAVNGRKYRS